MMQELDQNRNAYNAGSLADGCLCLGTEEATQYCGLKDVRQAKDGTLYTGRKYCKKSVADADMVRLADNLLHTFGKDFSSPREPQALHCFWVRLGDLIKPMDADQIDELKAAFDQVFQHHEAAFGEREISLPEEVAKELQSQCDVRRHVVEEKDKADARRILDSLVQDLRGDDACSELDQTKVIAGFEKNWRSLIGSRQHWLLRDYQKAIEDFLKEKEGLLKDIQIQHNFDGNLLHSSLYDYLQYFVAFEIESETRTREVFDQLMRKKVKRLMQHSSLIRKMEANHIRNGYRSMFVYRYQDESKLSKYDRDEIAVRVNEDAFFRMLFHCEKKMFEELKETDTMFLTLVRRHFEVIHLREHRKFLGKKYSKLSRAQKRGKEGEYLNLIYQSLQRAEGKARLKYIREVEEVSVSENPRDVEYRLEVLKELQDLSKVGRKRHAKVLKDKGMAAEIKEAIRDLNRFRKTLKRDASYWIENDYTFRQRRPSRSPEVLGEWLPMEMHPGSHWLFKSDLKDNR